MKYLKLVIIIIFLPVFISAQNIKNITIKTLDNFILIDSSIDTPLPQEIIELLKNGVKVTITYYINLKETQPFWMLKDKIIVSKNVKKIISYNMWEKTYICEDSISGKIVIKDEKNLQDIIKNIKNVKVASLKELKDKDGLYIAVKAKLESLKLFPPLSWIYDLVITRSFETPWNYKKIK